MFSAFLLLFLCGLLCFSLLTPTVTAHTSPYKINSLQKLKKAAHKKHLSAKAQKEIINESSPETLIQYTKYVDQEVSDIVNSSEPDEIHYRTDGCTTEIYRADIDALSSFELVIEDGPEKSFSEKAASAIKGMFLDEVSAAKNGEEKWKSANGKTKEDKGNHYFTAKYKRYIGPGFAQMMTENHYNVTSDCKIKERYGESWVDTFYGVTASLYGDPGHTIEDKWAKKEGEDAHIKTRFTVKYSAYHSTSYVSYYERTTIKLLKKDKKNKRVKVKHSWKAIN